MFRKLNLIFGFLGCYPDIFLPWHRLKAETDSITGRKQEVNVTKVKEQKADTT